MTLHEFLLKTVSALDDHKGTFCITPLEWCFQDVVIGLFQHANYLNLSNTPSRKTQSTRLHILSRKDDKLQLFLFQHCLGSVNACTCTYQSLADHLYQELSCDWPKWLEQWYILSQICGQRRSFEGLLQQAKCEHAVYMSWSSLVGFIGHKNKY